VSSRYVAGVFYDQTKVFDCANHELLLKKLQFYGVKGILSDWFKSYLCNRKQRVELNFSGTCNYSSAWKTVKSAVPQVSVLGPLMFDIYINNFMGSVDNGSDVTMYANDTSILISNSCNEEPNRNFSDVLYNTLKWFQGNQLVLNMGKTEIVKFTPANFSDSPLHITFGENLPVKANATNSLGLQLDSQLSWKPYINYLLHKRSSAYFIMRRLSPIHNIQTSRTLYFAHFLSLVNYGIIFWGNTSFMRKVFLTQKKIFRIMLGISPQSFCRKWFKKLEILRIPSLHIYSLMLFLVDNVHYFQTNSSVRDINTRYKNQLHVPSVRLSAIQRGITYSAIKIFN
jgi:hypothetical protein